MTTLDVIFQLGQDLVTSLSQLEDVQLASLAAGETLAYDSGLGKWVNVAQAPPGSVMFQFIGGSPTDNAALAAVLNAKFSASNKPTASDVTGFDAAADDRVAAGDRKSVV